jgi:hypothetical protein
VSGVHSWSNEEKTEVEIPATVPLRNDTYVHHIVKMKRVV